MLVLLYSYAQYLMLKALFDRKLEMMHARLALGQTLDGIALDPEPIPWQAALDEANVRVRRRIVRPYLTHPVYQNAVAAYETLEARIYIGMLLTVLAIGTLLIFT